MAQVSELVNYQKQMLSFPVSLFQPQDLVPTAAVIAATAALVALDPLDEPFFRRTSSFNSFNKVFSGNTTEYGTIAAPVALFAAGLIRHDAKMQKTAVLAGEALVDAEILAIGFKDITKRLSPSSIPVAGNYSDTFFKSPGSALRGEGSFPSSHTITAFSVATVVARRYSNHRWVPYVAYGLAGAIGASRITSSAHFVSDVFIGGALGYSIGRFSTSRE